MGIKHAGFECVGEFTYEEFDAKYKVMHQHTSCDPSEMLSITFNNLCIAITSATWKGGGICLTEMYMYIFWVHRVQILSRKTIMYILTGKLSKPTA